MKLHTAKTLYASLPDDELADAGIRVSQDLLRRIDAIVPAVLVEGSLEVSLSQPSDAVDVWGVIPPHKRARKRIKKALCEAPDTELTHLFNDWLATGSRLNNGLAEIFLEFDHDGGLDPVVLARLVGSAKAKIKTVNAYLQSTAQRGLFNHEKKWLKNVRRLPGDMRIVCWLGSRGIPSLRIVCTVNILDVPLWLETLDVTQGEDVRDILHTINGQLLTVALQLSPDDKAEFGLEIYLPQSDVDNGAHRLLFERLMHAQMLDAERADAICRWARHDPMLYRHLLVKPKFVDGALRDCKAYLGFSPAQ